MSESRETAQEALVVRLSVPAAGDLRDIAMEVAGKVAEYVGISVQDAASVSAAIDALFGQVARAGTDADVEIEFRRVDGELLIHARCEGRGSELRYPVPA